MVYVTTTKRLALRCDLPGCKATFHPRWVAVNRIDLRELAWRQGWNILSRDRDYCCGRHAALATGQPVDPPEERRNDPICGEDTCAACEQTTCRPNNDCDDGNEGGKGGAT